MYKTGIRIEFQPRDLWIGLYWNSAISGALTTRMVDVYICVLPMLPIHFHYRGPLPEKDRQRWLSKGWLVVGDV